MRVYKDVLSGDEMISDSYPFEMIHEDAVMKVQSRLISKNKNDDFGIGGKCSISSGLRTSPIQRHDSQFLKLSYSQH